METRNLKGLVPKTVLDVRRVELVLVTYINDDGRQITQPSLVGKNAAMMLNAPDFGFGRTATPVGEARPWLLKGIHNSLDAQSEDTSALVEEKPKRGVKK